MVVPGGVDTRLNDRRPRVPCASKEMPTMIYDVKDFGGHPDELLTDLKQLAGQ